MSEESDQMASDVGEVVTNSQEAVRLERRRNRLILGFLSLAMLFNAVFITSSVVRDRARTQTIEDLAKAIDNLTVRNKSLGNQLDANNARGDQALTEAFRLLNELREAQIVTAEQLTDNSNRIRQIEADLTALLGRRQSAPIINVETPPAPAPVVLPSQTSPPVANSPPAPMPTIPKNCVISLLGIDLICT